MMFFSEIETNGVICILIPEHDTLLVICKKKTREFNTV